MWVCVSAHGAPHEVSATFLHGYPPGGRLRRATSRSSCEAKCFGVIRRGSLYPGNQFRMTLMGLGVKLQSSPMTKRI